MDALEVTDVLELIENCQDTLDEIWKQAEHKPYPEKRMRHLLEIMGKVLWHRLWLSPYILIAYVKGSWIFQLPRSGWIMVYGLT